MLGESALVRTDPQTQAIERKFDLVFLWVAFFVLGGTFFIWQMLVAGDWDFWTDWKDRRWWVVVTPIVTLPFIIAAQTVLWQQFRLPFGATLTVLALLSNQWFDRIANFYGWTWYPLNFVFPATLIPGALAWDTILLLTGSSLITSLFGGLLWGLLFYPTNWFLIAPFHQPVEYLGQLTTLADVQGQHYIRTSTPEYNRIIERGTLRSFGNYVTWVSSFFAGFMSVVVYWVGYAMGKLFGDWGAKIWLRRI